MPYAFLVSTLGAITSAAVALFAIRTWSAMQIAPVVGAIIGLAVGVATLKLRSLPLNATLEEYKAAGKGGSLQEGCLLYFWAALNFAVLVSIVEGPILLISRASAPVVVPAGWIVICIHLFWRVWRLNAETALSNDLDVFKVIGGTALIGMVGVAMYFAYSSLFLPSAGDALTLIKLEVAANLCAALGGAVIVTLGMGVIGLFAERIDTQEYR